MKKLCVYMLVFALLFALPVMADQAESKQGVATEYLNEGMLDNFETEPVANTAATAEGLEVSATAALLMERHSGRVLYEKHPDERRAPASITKVMTLLLTMEAIENGKLSLTEKAVCSSHASHMGGSQIWLEEGETMTVDELLKAVCVASANDAAVALAEHLAGSEEAFVAQMNVRAKELGMTNTNFVNCCGLDADNHYTTARDIALMSRALLSHELITDYSTLWMDTLRSGETQLVNTNKLVRFYEGATGLKTGTTDDAGYCVTATAAKNGMELVAVILNGATSDKRFADAKLLLNFGFANYALCEVHPEDGAYAPLPVKHGIGSKLSLIAQPTGPFLVQKGQEQAVESKIELPELVEAPVADGQAVGQVTYWLNGTKLGESPLLAKSGISRLTLWRGWFKLLRLAAKN